MAVTKVVMPKLSEAMETGKLLRWLKQEGDRVSGGDIIAEIETDKADIELEAFGSGVLRKLLATPGTAVPVGGLIAVIADPDDDISALVGGGAPAPKAASPAPAPAAPAAAPAAPPAPKAPAPAPAVPAPAVAVSAPDGERLRPRPRPRWRRPPRRCWPAAGSASRRSPGSSPSGPGVDLTRVTGTGPSGRIIQRDIEAFVAGASGGRAGALPAAAMPAAAAARTGPEAEDIPLSPIRSAIARQMVQSKAPVPHFYITTEIAMERAASSSARSSRRCPGRPRSRSPTWSSAPAR